MTTPDLVALRVIVEGDPAKYIAAMLAKLDDVDKEAFNFCIRQGRRPVTEEGEPALAALRALVDRAGTTTIYCSCYSCQAIRPLVPAAQAALERVAAETTELRTKYDDAMEILTRWGNIDATAAVGQAIEIEHQRDALNARLAQLEEAQAQSARDVSYWRRRAEGAEQMSAQQEIRLARADGALADAETVATDDIERGIRMLTGERNLLRARLARLEGRDE